MGRAIHVGRRFTHLTFQAVQAALPSGMLSHWAERQSNHCLLPADTLNASVWSSVRSATHVTHNTPVKPMHVLRTYVAPMLNLCCTYVEPILHLC